MSTILSLFISLFLLGLQNSYGVVELHDPATTIDGVTVKYGDLEKLNIEFGQSGPATAIYNELGAYILYDTKVINQVSPLAQYLILEHERAHHRLGHTLKTKIARELGLKIPNKILFSKEKDADCEAGYSLKDDIDSFGIVTREEIKSAMLEIYYAIVENPQKILPEWLLSRMDVIDVCYKGKLLPRPKPIENVLEVFEQKMKGLSTKPLKRHHGPNCWNTALYMSNLAHQVRFTSNEEFHHIIESPYCKTLNNPEPKAIKIYRSDLPSIIGAEREMHATLWIDKDNSFNKMTAFSTSPYKTETHDIVDDNYKYLLPITNFSVENDYGKFETVKCEKTKCENEIVYKKCQDLKVIESDIQKTAYLKTYHKILKVEREISSKLFSNNIIKESVKIMLLAKLTNIVKEIAILEVHSSLDQWQVEYFQVINQSLKDQLIMRQPNWLNP